MRGIKGFYHKANRERSGEQDIDAKFEVAKILREKWCILTVTGVTLDISEGKVRLPDLYSKQHKIAIEIDGNVHDLTARGMNQTTNRNEEYKSIGVKVIVINEQIREFYDLTYEQYLAVYMEGLNALTNMKREFV